MNSVCKPALNIDQGVWGPRPPKQWIAVPAGVQLACRFTFDMQASFGQRGLAFSVESLVLAHLTKLSLCFF
jgi:hypothetical protein